MKRTEIANTKLIHYARLARRNSARAALAACVIATLPATGCRSGKSSWNMFGRSEPSAEVLAGSGPTTTYPSPPSARATPEAIASIAGGTTPDATKVAAATPETSLPAAGTNPYALAGNRSKTPESSVPTGFPTGKVPPSEVPPTVSTTIAASENSVPPAYALPGRSGASASSDLAATANGYGGVAAASSPSKPTDAGGLPSGYQLGKAPVADADPALANSPPTQASAFSMPAPGGMPAPGTTAAAGAPEPARSGGFGLPSDMIPPVVPSLASAPPTAAASTVGKGNESTAVAALGLPPSSPSPVGDSTPNATSATGASAAPAYQTAAASKAKPASGNASSSPSGVEPTGYMPGSTSKSSSYPVMR